MDVQLPLARTALDQAYERLTFGLGRSEPPLPSPRGRTGFARLVVGVDGSASNKAALLWAREMAGEQATAVHLVAIAAPPYTLELAGSVASAWEAEVEGANATLQRARSFFERAGVPVETKVLSGSPARELVRFAQAQRADLLIVGSRGRRRMTQMLLGSVAESVKARAPMNVLVARTAPPAERILVGADGSALGRRAAEFALKLRDLWDGELRLLHVLPGPAFTEGPSPEHHVARLVQGLDLRSWQTPKVGFDVRFGDPAARLLEEASTRRCDLLVVGCRGLGSWRTFVPGSTSTRIAQESKANVLIIKDPPLETGP